MKAKKFEKILGKINSNLLLDPLEKKDFNRKIIKYIAYCPEHIFWTRSLIGVYMAYNISHRF
jgi:hypothetical protein